MRPARKFFSCLLPVRRIAGFAKVQGFRIREVSSRFRQRLRPNFRAALAVVLLCGLLTVAEAEKPSTANAFSASTSGQPVSSPSNTASTGFSSDGNRLTYLNELNPYYPSHRFAKLVTPQWVGEEGVEAAVILAIDDMRDTEKYEAYLRPILQRLKAIDGRAPVSIMTCKVRAEDPQLQSWLEEGLSIEIHTIDHPCPLLKDSDFEKAKQTYEDCVLLMNRIPGNKPVAFRMPCCDSLNTVSPRAFAEIFNRTAVGGDFLEIDTSVFNVLNWKDPELPREIVFDEEGKERFAKYLPADRTFVNTIENYPYPYVIGGLCWEFPCVTPSDWSAQHYHKPNNPLTIRDWKAYLDACVVKQGVFNLVFHPHGWIGAERIVEFIDYAQSKYGNKVKFLTFREAAHRINSYMLAAQPLRGEHGSDNGVRVLDVNNDGYMDVVIANERMQWTRIWQPEKRVWEDSINPVWEGAVQQGNQEARNAAFNQNQRGRYGVLSRDGQAAFFPASRRVDVFWRWDGQKWSVAESLTQGLKSIDGKSLLRQSDRANQFEVLFRDLDGDGICELIAGGMSGSQRGIFQFDEQAGAWHKLPFTSPLGFVTFDHSGNDIGTRFVDINEDGYDDLIASNNNGYEIWLFSSMETGWDIQVKSAVREEKSEIPPIMRGNTNNGAWFHSRHMWVQNEDTANFPDLVARVSFDEILADIEPRAISPQQSCALIETRPGFTAELMAAEPLVMDPVAFEWGADGKLWVAEMADYPLGLDNDGQPGGRVRFLEDSDNDGKYDKSTLFLDGLNFPNGVFPWRKGVLVSAAPEILYAEDIDGDGHADIRETLYKGFIEGNQQHRVNGFSYGLDGWLYCANGDSDGDILSVRNDQKLNIRGHDFRIDPDSGAIELQAGKTQFGRNRDDWGNWFGSSNSDPMYHFVLPEEALIRNRALVVSVNKHSISREPGPSPVHPISRPLSRYNDFDRLNRFTSACSAVIYRDDLFGPEYAGNAFISEPVHNLVHREVVSAKGLMFTSKRADDEQTLEFLASRDNWFRPTMIKTGPDGALWIADMYRHLIEHPQYIPKEQWNSLPMRAGDDRGRLYRVYPMGSKPRAIPRLEGLSTDKLVAALDSSSGWQRDTAQRLLIERQDQAAVSLLQETVRHSVRGTARLHALCTLGGLKALNPDLVLQALDDPEAGVRRHAIRLSGPFLAKSPEIGPAILKQIESTDLQVRLQLAITLGEWEDPRAEAVLARLLLENGEDQLFATGVLSSLNEKNVVGVLKECLRDREQAQLHPELTGRIFALATATVSENDAVLSQVLDLLFKTGETGSYQTWQFAALAEAFDARERRGRRFWRNESSNAPDLSQQRPHILEMLAAARSIAVDESAELPGRIVAVRLLGRDEDTIDQALSKLEGLLAPQVSSEMQQAAVARLAQVGNEEAIFVLVDGWRGYGPELRGQVLDAILSRRGGSEYLLDAIDEGRISAAEISADRRERLLRARFGRTNRRAEKIFEGSISADRKKVVEEYQSVLSLEGDLKRGEQLFAKHCAACHKINDKGHAVGPDLAALKDRKPESLLVSIFDPNRAVETKFLSYVAVTTAGQTFTGILANEAGGSITLLAAEGKQQVLLRQDIEELQSTAKSAMPEGLEKDITPQDAADLIQFLQLTGQGR
jgi:putative membrane-bound dehydrogenase-like protein